MTPATIVIDDFLADPEGFRAIARGLNFSVKGPYPGLSSVENIRLDGLDRLIAAFVQEPVRVPSPLQSHGKFRLSLSSDETPGKIHVDPSYWSGVLYLSRPEDCRGGTEFYRHIASNTDRVPRSAEELAAAGFDSYDDLKQALDADSDDPSKWELTMQVPMRFNRLVLLQPHYWHTAGPGFGSDIEDGRLVYLMFFWPGVGNVSAQSYRPR